MKMVSFPGAQLKDILHYSDDHLTNSFAATVILQVKGKVLLEDISQSKIENLGKHLKSMVGKCHTYGYKNIFISGLVYTTTIGLPVLEGTHKMMEHLCNILGIYDVNNRNIRKQHLWKDSLHLVESGKVNLAHKFLFYLFKCY